MARDDRRVGGYRLRGPSPSMLGDELGELEISPQAQSIELSRAQVDLQVLDEPQFSRPPLQRSLFQPTLAVPLPVPFFLSARRPPSSRRDTPFKKARFERAWRERKTSLA
jgi:hypothetical protein